MHEPEHDHCAQCGGELVKIGKHVAEKLDVIPLQFKVRRNVSVISASSATASIGATIWRPWWNAWSSPLRVRRRSSIISQRWKCKVGNQDAGCTLPAQNYDQIL